MDPRSMIKKSGLSNLKRAIDMPSPTLMTKPSEEVKIAIKKILKVYKPK
jgi:hypothetical protein